MQLKSVIESINAVVLFMPTIKYNGAQLQRKLWYSFLQQNVTDDWWKLLLTSESCIWNTLFSSGTHLLLLSWKTCWMIDAWLPDGVPTMQLIVGIVGILLQKVSIICRAYKADRFKIISSRFSHLTYAYVSQTYSIHIQHRSNHHKLSSPNNMLDKRFEHALVAEWSANGNMI